MDQDSLLIAKHLIEASQQGNPFKDFIFPVLSSLFSAIMGGLIAIHINNKQENFKSETEKFKNSMKLMFSVVESLNNLVAIKSNYFHIESRNPYVRIWDFPETLVKTNRIAIDLSDFWFIKEVKTCNFSKSEKLKRFLIHRVARKEVEKPSKLELGKSWRNLSRVGAMISNYNSIIFQLEKRNNLDDEARKKILHHLQGKSFIHEGEYLAAVNASLSRKEICNLVDITESLISLVDHVIKEMDSFVRNFPAIAESNIDISRLKSGKKLIRYENDREAYINYLNFIIEPDFNMLAQILGSDIDSIKKRYTFTDWY